MKHFFEIAREKFGPLTQNQVDGINVLLEASEGLPLEHRAYILATAWHETARTMRPIEEYGKGRNKPYGKKKPPHNVAYYGRGYVQLTWQDNYAKATKKLRFRGLIGPGDDLEKTPELAMVPKIAASIIVIGMTEGWFNGKGKGLSAYDNYREMRRTVNLLDKADAISDYAERFEAALRAAEKPSGAVPQSVAPSQQGEPSKPPVQPQKPKEPPSIQKVMIWIVGAAFAAIAAWFGFGGQ